MCGIVRETNVKNGERFIFNLDQSQRPAQEKFAREYWYDFCQDPTIYTTESKQQNPSYQQTKVKSVTILSAKAGFKETLF